MFIGSSSTSIIKFYTRKCLGYEFGICFAIPSVSCTSSQFSELYFYIAVFTIKYLQVYLLICLNVFKLLDFILSKGAISFIIF